MCQRCLAQYVTEVSRIRYADIMLYPGSQHLLYRGMFLGLKFQVFLRLRLTFVTVCVCVCVCGCVCVCVCECVCVCCVVGCVCVFVYLFV